MDKSKKIYGIYIPVVVMTLWGLVSAVLFLVKFKDASCNLKTTAADMNMVVYLSCSFSIRICDSFEIWGLAYNNYALFSALLLFFQVSVYFCGSYLILKALSRWDERRNTNQNHSNTLSVD